MQVLRLLATGKTNRDIAEALFISDKTVARHVSNIFDKLGVSTAPARPPGPSGTTSSDRVALENTQFRRGVFWVFRGMQSPRLSDGDPLRTPCQRRAAMYVIREVLHCQPGRRAPMVEEVQRAFRR